MLVSFPSSADSEREFLLVYPGDAHEQAFPIRDTGTLELTRSHTAHEAFYNDSYPFHPDVTRARGASPCRVTGCARPRCAPQPRWWPAVPSGAIAPNALRIVPRMASIGQKRLCRCPANSPPGAMTAVKGGRRACDALTGPGRAAPLLVRAHALALGDCSTTQISASAAQLERVCAPIAPLAPSPGASKDGVAPPRPSWPPPTRSPGQGITCATIGCLPTISGQRNTTNASACARCSTYRRKSPNSATRSRSLHRSSGSQSCF